MDFIKLVFDAIRLCFPSASKYLERTVPVSLGSILFVLLVFIGLVVWVARRRPLPTIVKSGHEPEQARVRATNLSPPHSIESERTTYQRFPKQGVLYAVSYRSDKLDDPYVGNPRCLRHGTEMVPARLEREVVDDDWYQWNRSPYNAWTCKGCEQAIPGALDTKLRIEAKSRGMKQGKPEIFVG